MRRLLIIIIMLAFAAVMTSCGSSRGPVCPACGDDYYLEFTDCPICGMHVCENCADPYYYYESGKMEQYLKDQEALVFDGYDKWDDALNACIEQDIDWVIERIEDHGYTVLKDGKEN